MLAVHGTKSMQEWCSLHTAIARFSKTAVPTATLIVPRTTWTFRTVLSKCRTSVCFFSSACQFTRTLYVLSLLQLRCLECSAATHRPLQQPAPLTGECCTPPVYTPYSKCPWKLHSSWWHTVVSSTWLRADRSRPSVWTDLLRKGYFRLGGTEIEWYHECARTCTHGDVRLSWT